jgi:hypothetical protein
VPAKVQRKIAFLSDVGEAIRFQRFEVLGADRGRGYDLALGSETICTQLLNGIVGARHAFQAFGKTAFFCTGLIAVPREHTVETKSEWLHVP